MKKTIYKYREMIENELLISQGDIFCNLPYLTYDYLIQSSPNLIAKFQNERDIILSTILRKGGKIQVEGFIDSHWGILASQDCDILPNKDLIFFPLEETKSLLNSQKITENIDNNIKNTTRRLYLPIISPPNTKKKYGPFDIIFHNPFNVPYNLIKDNLKHCWRARIIEPARKIFIGKLSHFYSRTPIEEIIFLENREITRYFSDNWKEFWKETEEEFQKKANRIKEARKVLKFVKREQDLNKIFYFDRELISNIKDFLTNIYWYKNAKDLIEKCNDLTLKIENEPNVANSMFKDLINEFIIKEDSLLVEWKDIFRKIEPSLKRIRMNGKRIPNIILDETLKSVEDYKECANKAFNSKKFFRKFPDYLKGYSEYFEDF